MRLPLVLSTCLLASSGLSAADHKADVIVYGSTPGGFCAAIGAAREGASVILVEPTDHVGGVNTGGLSFSDSNQTVRSTLKGLFEEWHLRIAQDYKKRGITLNYDVSVKDHSTWTYEPSVAMRVTQAMLAEAKVQVVTEQPVISVEKKGPRITILRTRDDTFQGRVYIDATYEGDLMAAAGVDWTIGREGRAEHGESLAGKQYPKPTLPISGLDAQGKPLPLITTTAREDDEAGDKNVMVYSFRLCVTDQAANRVPFPEPDRYDPARFEVVRRYFAAAPTAPLQWDLYPLPGGKYDANNGIGKQFSMGLVGACNGWSEAGPEERQKIWEAHKQYTLEFYKFLTTDPAVPESHRQKFASLGLCKDEFPQHGHWSPQLYVREGRRMKGAYFITQKDIDTQPAKEDPIAVSSFPIDSHDCRRIALPDGGVVNEGTIFPVRLPGRRHGPAYHIPYRSILPRPDQGDNLLVPVALSCTHVAISSIRVEPTWMAIGHSAGVAAALVAKKDVPAHELAYPVLRERLLAQGQVLDLPTLPPLPPAPKTPASLDPASLPGIVMDDASAQLTGAWDPSSNFKPHVGRGYVHDGGRGDGQSTATFRIKLPKSGRYTLGVAYSPHPTRSQKVPVIVKSGGEESRLTLDQTQPLDQGSAFRTLGTLDLAGGGTQETTVTVTNTGTEGFVILDAIQFLEAKQP